MSQLSPDFLRKHTCQKHLINNKERFLDIFDTRRKKATIFNDPDCKGCMQQEKDIDKWRKQEIEKKQLILENLRLENELLKKKLN